MIADSRFARQYYFSLIRFRETGFVWWCFVPRWKIERKCVYECVRVCTENCSVSPECDRECPCGSRDQPVTTLNLRRRNLANKDFSSNFPGFAGVILFTFFYLLVIFFLSFSISPFLLLSLCGLFLFSPSLSLLLLPSSF